MNSFNLPRTDMTMDSNESIGFGTLRTEVGNLPLQQLGYQTQVVALALRTTIKQTFYNPFDECIEATYVFPIEGEQAVVACEIWVGTRLVRAKLKERGQARADYRRAISKGYRAALLEQNRGETFSMKVGNIPPGEAIQVRIETIGNLAVVHGEWTLRLPLVIAPRYTSGFPLPGASVGTGVNVDTDQVPDASMVTPPTLLPGFKSPVNLSIEVNLTPGALACQPDWPQQLRSSLHSVVVQCSDNDRPPASCTVRIRPGEKVDRDFILRGVVPQSQVAGSLVLRRPALIANSSPQSTFALTLVPPACESQTPRDIVFLLDRSGSMSGWKMAAARRGISRLVDLLGSRDRFQVIAFDDRIETPNERWMKKWLGKRAIPAIQLVDATDANRYEATRWLARIESRGGTEMGMALTHCLQPFIAEQSNRSSAIVLVTDGQITGEDSVLRLLGTVPADSRPRLFCLGIDTAVNAGGLQRLAKFTGGIFELVESETRLDEVMNRFGKEMGSPSLTNLQVESLDAQCQISQLAPCNQTALYSGRPVAIYGRVSSGKPLRLAVRGRLSDGSDWSTELTADEMPAGEAGVDLLLASWGRSKLRQMEDEFCAAPSTNNLLKNAIIQCSLEANVLSRFTAFVAIDESERVNLQGQPHSVTQPVELPEGWRPAAAPLIARERLIPRRQHVAPLPSAIPSLFAESVLQKGLVGFDQLSEAESLARSTGLSVNDAIVKLQYMTSDEAARVLAELHSMPYIDLRLHQISEQAIELIPESVARENTAFPIASSNGSLTVVVSDPSDVETIEKLRFILNRNIETMIASGDSIRAAINHYYGQVEGESADSMLQEFTDTAIDFSESVDDGDYDDNDVADDDDLVIDSDQFDGGSTPAAGYFASFGFALPAPKATRRRSLAIDSSIPMAHSPSESPVVRMVSLLISEAVTLRASHVILAPTANAIEVFYVIDGRPVSRDSVPRRMLSAIVARFKILAKMDIANCEPVQSGVVSMMVGNQPLQLSIHFAATSNGVSVLVDMGSGTSGNPPTSSSMNDANQPQCVLDWWQAADVTI